MVGIKIVVVVVVFEIFNEVLEINIMIILSKL
jgi:hypothetical protein